jgi:hypothetical protein
MRASDAAGLVLVAIAVTGCGPVFGVETPAWLASTPSSHLYDGQARASAPAWPPQHAEEPAPVSQAPAPSQRPNVIELRAPAVIVLRAPPGTGPDTVINATCAAPPAPVSRFRPSPYGDDEDDVIPTRPPYKPSPYEDTRPPRLYRDD